MAKITTEIEYHDEGDYVSKEGLLKHFQQIWIGMFKDEQIEISIKPVEKYCYLAMSSFSHHNGALIYVCPEKYTKTSSLKGVWRATLEEAMIDLTQIITGTSEGIDK